MNKPYSIAIHGGAGTILRESMTAEKEKEYTNALRAALDAGYEKLQNGGTSIDAVEAAILSLEDCPLFNAGRGAVFNSNGGHEMDAAIMNGADLSAGAVSLVTNVRNPIKLARAVMEHSPHVFLAGNGAMAFAAKMQLEFEEDEYFFDLTRAEQFLEARKEDAIVLDHTKKFGTVGAVALDVHRNLAAATSTGGMTNKRYGRIGDSPIIGAGTYANNQTCAISCTGHGELFIRSVVAHDISCLMEYGGLNLKEACNKVVYDKLVRIGGEGGLIAIDQHGNIELPFNSAGMYRALRHSDGRAEVAIYK